MRPAIMASVRDRIRSVLQRIRGAASDEESRHTIKVVLAFVPLAVVIALNLSAGTFGLQGCSPIQILPFTPNDPRPGCTTVPFLADLPSLALAITATIATLSYVFLLRRWRTFPESVLDTQIYRSEVTPFPDFPRSDASWAIQVGCWTLRHRRTATAVYAVIAIVAAGWLYSQVSQSDFVFASYARSVARHDPASAVAFRDSWWAATDVRPWGTAELFGQEFALWRGARATAWQLLGALGFVVALKALVLNFLFSKRVDELPTEGLFASPIYREADGGWGIFARILDFSLWGAVLAVGSFAAILYLLYEPATAGWVYIVLATLMSLYVLNALSINYRHFVGLKRRYAERKAAMLAVLEAEYLKVTDPSSISAVQRVPKQSPDDLLRLETVEREINVLQQRFVFPKSRMVLRVLRVPAAIVAIAAFASALLPLLSGAG